MINSETFLVKLPYPEKLFENAKKLKMIAFFLNEKIVGVILNFDSL